MLARNYSRLGHEPDSRLGWSSEYVTKSMHACHTIATVCLLHAGQWKRAGDAAKSGAFIGEFLWVTYDPIAVKGLKDPQFKYNLQIIFVFSCKGLFC